MLLINNRNFYLRLRGLSILDVYDIMYLSCSGVMSRSLGMVWDVRLFSSYELYFLLQFDYCFCYTCFFFDRFYIRLFDMRMSLLIVKQLFFNIFFTFGFLISFDYLYVDMTIETIIMLFYSV